MGLHHLEHVSLNVVEVGVELVLHHHELLELQRIHLGVGRVHGWLLQLRGLQEVGVVLLRMEQSLLLLVELVEQHLLLNSLQLGTELHLRGIHLHLRHRLAQERHGHLVQPHHRGVVSHGVHNRLRLDGVTLLRFQLFLQSQHFRRHIGQHILFVLHIRHVLHSCLRGHQVHVGRQVSVPTRLARERHLSHLLDGVDLCEGLHHKLLAQWRDHLSLVHELLVESGLELLLGLHLVLSQRLLGLLYSLMILLLRFGLFFPLCFLRFLYVAVHFLRRLGRSIVSLDH